ncbi:unnamed protein product [Microthlaspi erraticum]|uniref:Bifunctional inhibitor/plant lipid transfer protein/seed storage helical domain-containing protein n=1 Tax=Microthlaspi erraticum TaxID=1685480 RepID=A0A6D2KFG4_9BRAS|nr:unnamed protein product [Microthlaspi erraticum]
MEPWRITLMAIAICLTMVVVAGEDKAIDKEACKEQRLGMATCLPYMKGQAKSPMPDCCSSVKQIINSDKNCICVFIQDRNDPDLGLQKQINNSITLTLPSICHVTFNVNVSKCPALLHLDPNSPEAQVFYAIAQAVNKISPASAPTSMSPTSGSDDDHNSSWRTSWPGIKNRAQIFRKRWMVLEVVAHFFVILYIFIQ